MGQDDVSVSLEKKHARSTPKSISSILKEYNVLTLSNIREILHSKSDIDLAPAYRHSGNLFNGVQYSNTAEVKSTVLQSASNSCELDPLPTCLLKEYITEISTVLTFIIYASLSISKVPNS